MSVAPTSEAEHAHASGPAQVRLVVDGYRGGRYNILLITGRYYGIARTEGAVDPERLQSGDFKERIFIGEGLAEVSALLDAEPKAFELPDCEPRIVEARHGQSHYAIVEYGGRHFAVATDDMPFEIGKIRTGKCRRTVHEAATQAEVERLIDVDPWAWSTDPAPEPHLLGTIATTPQDSATFATSAARITLKDATVSLPIHAASDTLKKALLRGIGRAAAVKLPVLRGVSLDIVPGERLGIVGRNGCGKTTLLKAIAGIYPLSEGSRHVAGSIAPVIAQGIGFDHALSVRINVKLSIAHMGRLSSYSRELEETILDFAELTHRADVPLQQLSSGQSARLAFAVTLFQTPDILILDEVFATGDVAFVGRATAAMTARIQSTPITLFVSHDLATVQRICTRCLLMAEGRIIADGPPAAIIGEYRRLYQGVAP